MTLGAATFRSENSKASSSERTVADSAASRQFLQTRQTSAGLPQTEVVAVVEVGDEAGVSRFPSEDSPCRVAGRRVVEGDHHREKPEVRLQPVIRDARG